MPFAFTAPMLMLAACSGPAEHGGPAVPGSAEDHRPFAGIAPDEVLHVTGTEPFWGGEISGTTLTWTTPEDSAGQTATVTRFAGRGGLSFSGTLGGQGLDMAVSPATCSDGMSDRTYPFGVTVQLGQQTLSGCGWTDRHGYTGGE